LARVATLTQKLVALPAPLLPPLPRLCRDVKKARCDVRRRPRKECSALAAAAASTPSPIHSGSVPYRQPPTPAAVRRYPQVALAPSPVCPPRRHRHYRPRNFSVPALPAPPASSTRSHAAAALAFGPSVAAAPSPCPQAAATRRLPTAHELRTAWSSTCSPPVLQLPRQPASHAPPRTAPSSRPPAAKRLLLLVREPRAWSSQKCPPLHKLRARLPRPAPARGIGRKLQL
jgi:hypothetical protein